MKEPTMRNSQTWHPAHIRNHRNLSPTVREFEIRPEGGVKPWTVGSHLKLRVLVDGREETRSYSLVGLHDPEVYRIAVKRADPSRGGSRYLWSLEAGAELLIGEPNNHFELAFNAPQFLLVAGGIGITPLVGMAQMLSARGADVRMRYAARSASELVMNDVLQQCLSDRLQTYCSDAGQRMNLDTEIAALAPKAQMLVCGPIALLDAAREAWSRAGRAPADLRFETFGNSGHHEVQPFWVELPRHHLRIEVPADRSLLDVLCEHGIDTLADCRRGECGLCTVDVISVQGRIDHRDVFMSEREQRE
ncbi:MAG: oxidoreductase, partial [Cytophagales bacterium]|nr:oxidoreductase [Rhizobacter sp.]